MDVGHLKDGQLPILVAEKFQVLTPQLVHLQKDSLFKLLLYCDTLKVLAIFQPQTGLRVSVSACLDSYSLPRE